MIVYRGHGQGKGGYEGVEADCNRIPKVVTSYVRPWRSRASSVLQLDGRRGTVVTKCNSSKDSRASGVLPHKMRE